MQLWVKNFGLYLTILTAKSVLLSASLESTATADKRNKEEKILVSWDSAVAVLFHLNH